MPKGPTVYGHQVCPVCFLYTLVHLKGLVNWFSPYGHAQEGRGSRYGGGHRVQYDLLHEVVPSNDPCFECQIVQDEDELFQ